MNSGQLREEIELQKIKRRELLQEKCNEILTMRGYRRHDYGKNKTHCNRATERIAREMGYETTWMHYINRKTGHVGITGKANHIYIEALKAEAKKEITRVTQEEAKKLAWAGEVVILTARALPGTKQSGHVSIVYPSEGEIKVCNVGWWNLICHPEDKQSFGGGKSYLSPGIYFHMKRKNG